MKGLIYFGYAVAIVSVFFLCASAVKGLFKAWRDSAPPTIRRIIKKVR